MIVRSKANGGIESGEIMLDPYDQLLAIEAIKQLKARYCRLVDTKQWDELREQFVDDCRFEGTSVPYADADAFVDALRTSMAETTTIHQCHTPEIALRSENTARGIWAMFDFVVWAEGSNYRRPPEHPDMWGISGYGYYQEEYRKEHDDWKIAVLRHTRLRVDLLVGDRALGAQAIVPPALDWLPSADIGGPQT